MNQAENKLFWNLRAKDATLNDKSVTNNDIFRRELEIRSLIKQIPSTGKILEIGCGSGYGTKQFLKGTNTIVATDYSENMIELAKTNNADPRIEYKTQDVLSLNEVGEYDCVITQRCLINILDSEKQYLAIEKMIKSLKHNGVLLFLEGLKNGRDQLNQARKKYGLEEMPAVPFNLDFDVNQLIRAILSNGGVISSVETHGTYDFVSRVVYPSVIKPELPRYDSEINANIYNTMLDDNFNDLSFSKYSRTIFVVAKKIQ